MRDGSRKIVRLLSMRFESRLRVFDYSSDWAVATRQPLEEKAAHTAVDHSYLLLLVPTSHPHNKSPSKLPAPCRLARLTRPLSSFSSHCSLSARPLNPPLLVLCCYYGVRPQHASADADAARSALYSYSLAQLQDISLSWPCSLPDIRMYVPALL